MFASLAMRTRDKRALKEKNRLRERKAAIERQIGNKMTASQESVSQQYRSNGYGSSQQVDDRARKYEPHRPTARSVSYHSNLSYGALNNSWPDTPPATYGSYIKVAEAAQKRQPDTAMVQKERLKAENALLHKKLNTAVSKFKNVGMKSRSDQNLSRKASRQQQPSPSGSSGSEGSESDEDTVYKRPAAVGGNQVKQHIPPKNGFARPMR